MSDKQSPTEAIRTSFTGNKYVIRRNDTEEREREESNLPQREVEIKVQRIRNGNMMILLVNMDQPDYYISTK